MTPTTSGSFVIRRHTGGHDGQAPGASGVYEALDLMNKATGLDVGTVFAAIGLMFAGAAIAITGSVTPAQPFDWEGKKIFRLGFKLQSVCGFARPYSLRSSKLHRFAP